MAWCSEAPGASETFTSRFCSRCSSLASTQPMCMSSRFGPSTPSFSSRATSPMPYFRCEATISSRFSQA